MSLQSFELKTEFTGFCSEQKALILGAIRTAYEQSILFEIMIDNFVSNPSIPLQIFYQSGAPGAQPGAWNTTEEDEEWWFSPGGLHIDLDYLSNMTYLTDAGTAEPVTLVAAIVHELVHSLTGKEDNLTDEDYKGDTVRESNLIYAQLGIPLVNSYRGQDERGVLIAGEQYTNGAPIDKSFVALASTPNWDSSPAGNSSDLLIGDAEGNELRSGDGDDYLYGNGGVDYLFGGKGFDRYFYKSGDGADLIEDEREGDQQLGSIQFNGTILSGGSRPVGQTTYRWEDDNGNVYVADGDPDQGEVTLMISGAGGVVSVNNFKNGDLGITLKDDDEEKRGKPGTGLPGGHPGSLPQVPWPVIRDPLVLDLDGDGVETTRLGQQWVAFDHQGDGMRERSAWVGADDGLLVLDRDGNGTIDNGKELFGTDTVLRSGLRAKSGLQALAEWDSNQDGKIDSQDAIYAELQVWQDLNQDGVSQADELKRLDEQGIASISVAPTVEYPYWPVWDAAGNRVLRLGQYEKVDGGVGGLAEVDLLRDEVRTQASETYTESSEIEALPFLKGYGRLLDLRQALAKEDAERQAQGHAPGTGPLTVALNAYLVQTDSADPGYLADPSARNAARDKALDTLLYTWAGVTGVAPASWGAGIDARQAVFLESVFGSDLKRYAGWNATMLQISWQTVREYYNGRLLAQTSLADLYRQVGFEWQAEGEFLETDYGPFGNGFVFALFYIIHIIKP